MSKKKQTSKKSLELNKKLPVTLLSGFLGAGKTTLLKHILESNDHQMKIAVIVNDMAEINIDAALVKNTQLIQTQHELVSMQNGCICCTLRGDLIREIDRLQKTHKFDYLIIESTGISEPMEVAESFCAEAHDGAEVKLAESTGKMLWETAVLDTCVTVVDSSSFREFASSLKPFSEEFSVEK